MLTIFLRAHYIVVVYWFLSAQHWFSQHVCSEALRVSPLMVSSWYQSLPNTAYLESSFPPKYKLQKKRDTISLVHCPVPRAQYPVGVTKYWLNELWFFWLVPFSPVGRLHMHYLWAVSLVCSHSGWQYLVYHKTQLVCWNTERLLTKTRYSCCLLWKSKLNLLLPLA